MTRQRPSSPLVLALLAAAVLAISGCMPLAVVNTFVSPLKLPTNFSPDVDAFVSPLEQPASVPSVLVRYDEQGEASVWGVPILAFSETLGVDLSVLSLTPRTIETLMDAGVRVIHVENQPGGLRFSVDGEPLPSIVWDETAREHLIALLEGMGPGLWEIAGIVRLMPELGVGLTIALPGASEEDLEIGRTPLLDEDVAADLLAAARTVAPVVAIELSYDEQGVARGTLPPTFSMAGITPDTLAVPPSVIAFFQGNGIERLSILPTGDGLLISFNENELSFISWDDDELERMVCLLIPIMVNGIDCSSTRELTSFIAVLLKLPLNIDLTFPS